MDEPRTNPSNGETIAFEPPTLSIQNSAEPSADPLQEVQSLPTLFPEQEPEEAYAEPTVVPQPKRKRTSAWKITWRITKFVLRMTLGVLLAAAVLVSGLLGYLTVTEYTPAYAENADRGSENLSEKINKNQLRIVSFNTGYGALGEDADFFMDGGEGVNPESEEAVRENMSEIERILSDFDADFILLQEVDTDSDRSFHINQWLQYEYSLEDYESRFALNYSCKYVPYPLTENIGKVNSGIATYSRYDVTSATRYSLPNSFSWPSRVANLKRCLLVTRIPIEDSEKELVLVNLHLDAYDDGEGKAAQTEQLLEFIQAEYAKGNYVIAGGDFNQTFPRSTAYPIENEEYWTPGTLDSLPYGWRYAYDDSNPTCRLLNEPYDPKSENTQYYVIDGFIVSPNITIDEVTTVDCGFENSDHNPVVLDFVLQS